MPYSAVTQPAPLPLRKEGTFSSTEAVHSTRVLPNSISTEPSACMVKLRVMRTGRNWLGARWALRVKVVMAGVELKAGKRDKNKTDKNKTALGVTQSRCKPMHGAIF